MASKRNAKADAEFERQVKEYVRSNTWKRFLKYKVMELGVIPLLLLFLWQVPLQLGWGFIKLFNINPVTSEVFCKSASKAIEPVCDGVNYSLGSIWLIGLGILMVLSFFIVTNWKVAKSNVEAEAHDKIKK